MLLGAPDEPRGAHNTRQGVETTIRKGIYITV
jgi:hypothetical protein